MRCWVFFYYTKFCHKWKGAFAMKIVLLNVEQAQSIYRSQMVRDFPESELKPLSLIHI